MRGQGEEAGPTSCLKLLGNNWKKLAITPDQKSVKRACYGAAKYLEYNPLKFVAEFAHLPPQEAESFRFLRAGKGVQTGFSHLSSSGFFSSSGSKTIICYPTWHA